MVEVYPADDHHGVLSVAHRRRILLPMDQSGKKCILERFGPVGLDPPQGY